MKILAIVQARMGSTRLPDKVLADIESKPMVWHVIERLKCSEKLDDIVLAIPIGEKDNILEKFARKNNIKYFRGSEKNVLSRYYETAKKFEADIVLRITADCPLIDSKIVDLIIKKHLYANADYTSNVLKRTYPKGLDVEVISFEALEKSFQEAQTQADKEHVTLYVRNHPERFKRINVENNKNLSDFRWCVDEEKDLKFVREIYKKLYQKENIFFMQEIVNFLKKEPELVKTNKEIKRKSII